MRTRLPAALAVAAAALTLTACGGSSPAPSPSAPSVAQVAAQIGATGVSTFSPTLYASHEGTATWHGQRVDIATFATGQLRDQWEAAARQFGPILADGPGYAVTGGLPWLPSPPRAGPLPRPDTTQPTRSAPPM